MRHMAHVAHVAHARPSSTPTETFAFLMGTLLAVGACSSDRGAQEEPADPAQVQNAVVTSLGIWNDCSNTVHTQAWQCDWSPVAAHPHAECQIPDASYVLVGGGAEISDAGNPAAAGGLLTASYPSSDLTTWLADSKDHVFQSLHKLRAYAIGLKLDGVSAPSLSSQMLLKADTSIPAQHPEVSTPVPIGFLMVGGGAKTNYSGAGQLLTESYPLDATTWHARSKDHSFSDEGTVSSYAIAVPTCPAGFNGCLRVQRSSSSVTAAQGYVSKQQTVGQAVSSVGGRSTYNGAGRLLVNLAVMSAGGVAASSKDHEWLDSGTLEAHAMGVMRGGAGGGAGSGGAGGGGGRDGGGGSDGGCF
jgi:hypothetical protein